MTSVLVLVISCVSFGPITGLLYLSRKWWVGIRYTVRAVLAVVFCNTSHHFLMWYFPSGAVYLLPRCTLSSLGRETVQGMEGSEGSRMPHHVLLASSTREKPAPSIWYCPWGQNTLLTRDVLSAALGNSTFLLRSLFNCKKGREIFYLQPHC